MYNGKMDCILFGTGPRPALSSSFSITIEGKALNRASKSKYLRIVLDPLFTWNAHVDYSVGNVRQRVALLGPIMKNINMYMTGTIYTSVALPILDYCDAVWSYCGSVIAEKLEKCRGAKHVMRLVSFYYHDQNPLGLIFPFIFKFGNPSEVYKTEALICTRKQNPEGVWS